MGDDDGVALPGRWPIMRVDVSGSSMEPTLADGDWLLCRILGSGRTVKPGDIVVVRRPDRPELLLVKRNVDWANQLKTKLDGSGVSFVAVGSGHLVGAESVQAQLAKLGIKAERVK